MNYDIKFIAKISVMLNRLALRGVKEAIVAGGAVRDMLLEKPISDIDVFYTGDFKQAPEDTNDGWFNFKACDFPEYLENSFNVTHEGYYIGIPDIKVQLIKVKYNPVEYINGTFDADICLCYISEDAICLTTSFLNCVKNNDLGVIKTKTNKKHLEKLMLKYPTYTYSSTNSVGIW